MSGIRFGVSLLMVVIITAKSQDWDILVLQQQWPPGIKIELNKSHGPGYNITKVVKTWVIHGLWPSKSGTRGPDNCNISWKFDYQKIAGMRGELDRYWPNLFANTNAINFWSHEWTKHGTCGTSLPALSDEYHYFRSALNLTYTVDLTGYLASANIVPDPTKLYKAEDVQNAVEKLSGHTNPILQCVWDKVKHRLVLYSVDLCLDKSFKPVSCKALPPEPHSPVEDCKGEVLYPPITYTRQP